MVETWGFSWTISGTKEELKLCKSNDIGLFQLTGDVTGDDDTDDVLDDVTEDVNNDVTDGAILDDDEITDNDFIDSDIVNVVVIVTVEVSVEDEGLFTPELDLMDDTDEVENFLLVSSFALYPSCNKTGKKQFRKYAQTSKDTIL